MAMATYNIHEAKSQLSKLIEAVQRGETVVIAKAGKPMVKVVPLDAPVGKKMQRFGFMKDVGTTVPDDFHRMFDADIEELFGLNDTNSGETPPGHPPAYVDGEGAGASSESSASLDGRRKQ